jgi:hypothetical protein
MRKLLLLFLIACAFSIPARAQVEQSTIEAGKDILAQCSGGQWVRTPDGGSQRRAPSYLAPRLNLLARPSAELKRDESRDLYRIAKAFVHAAIDDKSDLLDPSTDINCSANVKEGLAIFEYLVGVNPTDLKGPTNAFAWLGHTYSQAVQGDETRDIARGFYLRGAMHLRFSVPDNWSDGVDDDLISNIERANMRPYLEELAQADLIIGAGAARMILAEEALLTDRAKARDWLSIHYFAALNRILTLEREGQFEVLADVDDIAFWAEASRKNLGRTKWADRMMAGVSLFNQGEMPVSSKRPKVSALRKFLNENAITKSRGTLSHIPVRALVDPSGNAIYTEPCTGLSETNSSTLMEIANLLDAARLYDATRLPKLPVTNRSNGRPAYSWVILPAVKIDREEDGKLLLSFRSVRDDECAYTDNRNPIPAPPGPIRPQ